MLKVGLTGGIGSGKTIVCNVFKQLGIPVYHADIYAKLLADCDEEIKSNLIALLGTDIYYEDRLDRKKLSHIIFNDSSVRQKVNSIVHPKVRQHFKKWISNNGNSKYIIQEAAILFESGSYNFFDKIITVTAPEELRINRIIERDGSTGDKIINIMRSQMSDDDKIKKSHYVIVNDNKKLIVPQILKIHKKLLSL